MRAAYSASVLAATIILSVGASNLAARAESAEPMIGHAIVCDTQDELEAVVKPSSDDVATRMKAINARFGPSACNDVVAIFVEGELADVMVVPDGVIKVLKVKIVAIEIGAAWLKAATPMDQFAAVHEPATNV
jgi:hypothetical protein